MQVFKAFLKIVWNHRALILTYVIIFLSLALGMASLGTGQKDNVFKEEQYEIAVFDYDKSDESKSFVDYMKTKTKLVSCEDDEEKLLDQLFARNIYAVIYIKEGYGESLNQGETENLLEITTLPGTTYSQSIESYVDRYMKSVSAYLATGMSTDEAIGRTDALLKKQSVVHLEGETATAQKSKVYYFMLYLPYILVSCCVQGVGFAIHTFQKRELKDRMNISSYSFRRRNMEIWGGTLVCGFGFAAAFILVSALVYRQGVFSTQRLLMIANLLISVLWTLGLTYLVSVMLKKESAFSMAGTVLGLVIAFLGGLFVPLSIMGDGIKMVSHFVPSYWYVTALDLIDAGTAGSHVAQLLTGMGIQLAFAVAFFAVGLGFTAKKRKNG